jgi:membrane protein DedA with SNARE-associated domain
MQALVDTLIAHGYLVLFAWVFAAQAGIPLPAIPILLAGGALAGTGQLNLPASIGLVVVASLLADSLWFVLGRRRGNRVLGLLCKLSLEPESCVRNTRERFARSRLFTVVLGKFVPGLSTMAPPLAGMFGMTWPRFLLLDGLGALLWTIAFALPGYLLADRLEKLAAHAASFGTWLFAAVAITAGLLIVLKIVRRHAFLRGLRIARVDAEELQAMLRSPQPPFVVDLRHRLDVIADPQAIPGAVHMLAEELEQRHEQVPRDRDVVLYCT